MLIVAAILGTAFAGAQAYMVHLVSNTTERPYDKIYSKEDFEIRYYPEVTMASVTNDGSYDDTKNKNFRVLAQYIFGSNKESKKISMTSPVEVMPSVDGQTTMSFMIPTDIPDDSIPAPANHRISLDKTEGHYAAVLKFGGWASDKVLRRKNKELAKILKGLRLEHEGEFGYLGYNPPYQVINRRNEVVVRLKKRPDIILADWKQAS